MLFLYYQMFYLPEGKEMAGSNHISYEERHIVEENPTYEELKQWYERGFTAKEVF